MFAHPVLPEEFANGLADRDRESLPALLLDFEPDVRPLASQQLLSARGRAANDIPTQAESRRAADLATPPMPREHPMQAQRDEERRAACARLKQDHAQQRELIKYYRTQEEVAKFRLGVAKGQIERLNARRADASVRLSRARSRLTIPGIPPVAPCPADQDKGRRTACEIVRQGSAQKWREQERERLEAKKARDIRDLEAEIGRIDREIEKVKSGMAADQQALSEAENVLYYAHLALSRIDQEYLSTGCGNPRDLWPIF